MLDRVTPQLPLWTNDETSGDWVVRESRRARRLSVRVFHSGRVEIVVPPRTPPNAVRRFVERYRDWIDRKRAEAREKAAPPEPFPPRQIEFAASGEQWRVHLAGGPGRPRASVAAQGLLVISGNAADAPAAREALRQWLLERAREVLVPVLDSCASELGLRYERVLVRRQRTRWGSCSARGTISLNCCLLFQRPPVVRYLCIHELAHTRHMNHSRRFWQCVARYCPDYEKLDRELLDGWRRVPSWVFGERHP